MSKGLDYSKWDNIELSDDEDDVHPNTNIDKESCINGSSISSSSAAVAMPSAAMGGGHEATGGAMTELFQQVSSMDCNEAYKHMCLAQDEIKRLQNEIKHMENNTSLQKDDESKNELLPSRNHDEASIIEQTVESSTSCAEEKNVDSHAHDVSNAIVSRGQAKSTHTFSQTKGISKIIEMDATGSWIDQGGQFCIEYLSNVKCYQITLTIDKKIETGSLLSVPASQEDLHLTMKQHETKEDAAARTTTTPLLISYYDTNLYRLKDSNLSPEGQNLELLLSTILPASKGRGASMVNPTARISTDHNSVSLRIQLQSASLPAMAMDGIDFVEDHLLGIGEDGYSLSATTSSVCQLNQLCCRSCQNPIIEPTPSNDKNARVIKSVLPLPAGYWDDISDYLICYDGQPMIDFTSSSTCAIPHTALEDDAVLVLDREDLAVGGVRSVSSLKQYGEHSSERSMTNNGDHNGSSQAWTDKSAVKGGRTKTLTCAKCCTTLGYISDQDDNTYRLYKHILIDGSSPPLDAQGSLSPQSFSKYTCGSFLAREMVRYAESEAVYTFIAGVSDENDWTRVHSSGEFILLRMLSWDTTMATLSNTNDTSSLGVDATRTMHFQKAVKVIFEVTSDKVELSTASDDPLEWTWRGNDFCCPPGSNPKGSNDPDEVTLQTKASSIRIFFSKQEWSELRNALECGAGYFSETVSDALVMTKLGFPSSDTDQSASLSFLPLVS